MSLVLRARVAITVTAFVLALAPAASADEKAAGEHFRAGASAYSRGDFRGAATEFERAYREAPRGAAIYNAAMAWESAGDLPRAADAFAVAVGRKDLDASQMETGKARLAAAQRALARVEITAPAGATVSIAHAERAPTPLKVHVKPGTYPISLHRSDGVSEVRSVQATAGAVIPVAFAAPEPAPVTPPPSAEPTPERPAKATPPPDPEAADRQRKVGLVIAGSSVVAVAAAAVFGLVALSAKDDFDSSGFRDADAHDRASTFRTLANVGWVTAGALVVTGAAVYLAAPRVKAKAGALNLTWRF